MQWKGPYVISECKEKSNYCIEIHQKKKNFHINMLKYYIEQKKDEGILKETEKDLRVEPVQVGVRTRETD